MKVPWLDEEFREHTHGLIDSHDAIWPMDVLLKISRERKSDIKAMADVLHVFDGEFVTSKTPKDWSTSARESRADKALWKAREQGIVKYDYSKPKPKPVKKPECEQTELFETGG